jgi:hypothetical protein
MEGAPSLDDVLNCRHLSHRVSGRIGGDAVAKMKRDFDAVALIYSA